MKLYRGMSALIAFATLAIAPQVRAQTVQFTGQTTGCFFTTGPCTSSDQGLSFTGANPFSTTTTDGSVGVVNLGTFSLSSAGAPDLYLGDNFFLNVLFTLPTLANPNSVFKASILGVVLPQIGGGLGIHFTSPPAVFVFNGPTSSGSFTLGLGDVVLATGLTGDLTGIPSSGSLQGYITTTTTPEPATIGLLAMGMLGLIPAARLRRRTSLEA